MQTVDPRYLTEPFWKLQLEMGSEWIRQQQELFKRIYEEEPNAELE